MMGLVRRRTLPTELAGILAVVRILPRVSQGRAALLTLGVLAATGLPLGFTVIAGFLVGSVPAAVRGGLDSAAGHHTLWLLGIAALIAVAIRLLAPFQVALAASLGRRVDRYLQGRVIAAVTGPTGIAHLEDPAVLDLIQEAQGLGTQGIRPGDGVTALASLLPSWLLVVGSTLILATFRWWLGVIWLILWPVVLFYLQREYIRVGAAASGEASALRRADYYRDLALTPGPAKEIRLWRLPEWLVSRYERAWRGAMEPTWQARKPGRAVIWTSTVVVVAADLTAFGLLAWAGAHGNISLAALAVYTRAVLDASAFRAFDDQNMNLAYAATAVPALQRLERILDEDNVVRSATLRGRDGGGTPSTPETATNYVFDARLRSASPLSSPHSTTSASISTAEHGRGTFDQDPRGFGGTGSRTDVSSGNHVATQRVDISGPSGSVRSTVAPPPSQPGTVALHVSAPQDDIRFEHLRFRYTGQTTDALTDVDLILPAGESLAIVGANGAGKTTIVKLLCRLYEPTGGSILVDGMDLAAVDPASWRTRVAAIFQDFARYHLSARDNVGMGAPHLAGDLERLQEAARKAGALELIEALPNGWDTILSRQYSGGVDLSGGQWQRIALARAMFAVEGGARVLILDEPTANLDVRAEAEIYDRFLEMTAGLTTILISHRFSTVRRAHRIVVLQSGRIAESGTHDELVRMGGMYAEMFRLQAERFADDVYRGSDGTPPRGYPVPGGPAGVGEGA